MSENFDSDVRTTLADAASSVTQTGDFADRLIAGARAGVLSEQGARATGGTVHRLPVRRFGTPLLVAAAVAALLLGTTAVVSAVESDRRHPAATNTPPTPLSTPVAPPTMPVPASFTASSVTFADNQHGWALGDGQCPTGSAIDCAAVIATSDGGRSWHRVATPPGVTSVYHGSCQDRSLPAPCVSVLNFATDRIGYASSAYVLFMTTDGGASWTRQPGYAGTLAFSGGNVLRYQPVTVCSASCPGRLQWAVVGSSDWHTVSPSGTAPSLYGSILTASPGTAYFVAITGDEQVATGPSAIYRSGDGGESWTQANPGLCSATGASTASDGALALLCRTADANSDTDPPDTTIVSTDGGRSFVAAHTTPLVLHNSGFLVAASGSVLLIDELTTGTQGSVVHRSTDGGVSWRPVLTDPGSRSTQGLAFTSATQGYRLAQDGSHYWTTEDAGASWQPRTFS